MDLCCLRTNGAKSFTFWSDDIHFSSDTSTKPQSYMDHFQNEPLNTSKDICHDMDLPCQNESGPYNFRKWPIYIRMFPPGKVP